MFFDRYETVLLKRYFPASIIPIVILSTAVLDMILELMLVYVDIRWRFACLIDISVHERI